MFLFLEKPMILSGKHGKTKLFGPAKKAYTSEFPITATWRGNETEKDKEEGG